ncbi:hypothetical protein Scep_007392 [Stephania cephalantha]|uniref:Uncharacterized protein n=1 Tax=Stephania cephalantha TaxID=152367 RepID=A0AAP0KCG3_9MAGN
MTMEVMILHNQRELNHFMNFDTMQNRYILDHPIDIAPPVLNNPFIMPPGNQVYPNHEEYVVATPC